MDNKPARDDKMNVPALTRAIQIMNLISASRQRLTISDISRELSIPKSSAYGLICTLEAHEILQKRDDQSFRVGPHVMRWSNSFNRATDVTDEFLTILDAESDLPGTSITLSVRDNLDVVYIAARNSDLYPSFFNFKIGSRLPAAFTATGKAFLMQMSDSEIRRLYDGQFPVPLTRYSVSGIESLLTELQNFRSLGYSIDHEQVTVGMRCYATTIFNSQNHVIAGLAVSVPADPADASEEERILTTLERLAKVISRRMGADIGGRFS
jgi:DNA-binding IclR family transcriptional regulator